MPSRIGLTNMGMLLARDVHDIDIRQKEENRWTDVDRKFGIVVVVGLSFLMGACNSLEEVLHDLEDNVGAGGASGNGDARDPAPPRCRRRRAGRRRHVRGQRPVHPNRSLGSEAVQVCPERVRRQRALRPGEPLERDGM